MRDETGRVKEPALRSELARYVANDQRVRRGINAAGGAGSDLEKHSPAVDSDDLRWLKAAVDKRAFPTIDQVDKSGFNGAWLLVQHADGEPEFQAAVLEGLNPLLASGEVSQREFAVVTDRVLRNQGKP
jgi:hypothetical protein